jgi:hypothetical protein
MRLIHLSNLVNRVIYSRGALRLYLAIFTSLKQFQNALETPELPDKTAHQALGGHVK